MQNHNSIKLACWNSRGFNTAIPYLRELIKENEILAIAEHWLHENKLSSFNDLCGDINFCGRASKFASAENYGTKRGQGGVALVWNKNISGISEITNIIHDRICGIRFVTGEGGTINIFSVYLPAQGSGEELEACLDDLAEILESREAGDLNIVCGDFNADVGNQGGPRGIKPPTKQGAHLMKLVNEFGLTICNLSEKATGPTNTYEGPTGTSSIDYIMVPPELTDRIISCRVIDYTVLNTSDHLPVQITLNVSHIKNHQKERINNRIKRWDKLGPEEIYTKYTQPLENSTEDLLRLLTHNDFGRDVLDDYINRLVDKMVLAADGIPTTIFRRHIKPYWNERLRNLKKDKVAAYRRWVEGGRPRVRGHPLWDEYKSTKKVFRKELKTLGKSYEDEQIASAVRAAEVDRGQFWRLVKKSRKGAGNKIASIKGKDGKVVSDINSILMVWKEHFQDLYTPKDSPEYDQAHFRYVTDKVAALNREDGGDKFVDKQFSVGEVKEAIGTLHKRKACGYDSISTEHLVYGGDHLAIILTKIYNHILRLEYIPTNMRRGIQIPLFKGKGTCCLDPDNYRGISLLTNFNKCYEVLVWNRVKEWWKEQGVISDLQGAGKKKQSCVHTALVLQESIATALEKHDKVFVAFLDVSKAYDTVWTDGLFFQLHQMGIKGKLWRLMYRAYIDFKSKVRIDDKTSDWFPMRCGIHQGGFLSLTKYVAFINSLITTLESSKLCCCINKIPSTPVGYADDIATACISKLRTDRALKIIYDYGCRWRFKFNAKKSAILVYGDTKHDHLVANKFRSFKLGGERIAEKLEYDHVGVKACILYHDNERVEEKIGKARRTLNAASGLGIRKNGLSMKTCNLIFWAIVIPTLTFGSEIWGIKDKDIEQLQSFQRYAGRRVQRFPKRSPASTSFFGLGWLRIETYIQVKKLLFLLTIIGMDKGNRVRMIYDERIRAYVKNPDAGRGNFIESPIFEILNTSIRFGLLDSILEMSFGLCPIMTKKKWSDIVWRIAWRLDDCFWKSTALLYGRNDLLLNTIGKPFYLNWWFMADNMHQHQGMCETMARLVCHTSLLKDDDIRLNGGSHSQTMCTNCNLGIRETVQHLVMQCPANEGSRITMFREIEMEVEGFAEACAQTPEQVFLWLLGKQREDCEPKAMISMWTIAGWHICRMYNHCIRSKEGVG